MPDSLKQINDKNKLQAGKLVALLECTSCHTLKKGFRSLKKQISKFNFDSYEPIMSILMILENYPYMPSFVGTQEEMDALAYYLYHLSKSKD